MEQSHFKRGLCFAVSNVYGDATLEEMKDYWRTAKCKTILDGRHKTTECFWFVQN